MMLRVVFAIALACCGRTALGQAWVPLGPDGGDVRSLAYDPHQPSRIFLGTSTGALFVSDDNGASWTRFAHLGSGNDYVLDHIEIDPQSGAMYVAAWDGRIEHENGDLFRSLDGGKTWQALPDMHGKSIRAMTLAPSEPKVVLAGALDGVFRSRDGGNTFARISPLNHAEIRNIESLAVDPKDPDIVYAGTWHLPWKTGDGGQEWHSIKQGVIDDSDVFSIIADYSNPEHVFLSACSGIYHSEDAAEHFHKFRGIPFSARRTRVLKQDPMNPAVIYAGTTEGLWKTEDAGKSWLRITETSVIVNDVHVDPRNSSRLLIATDRGGVLASDDAGRTFAASNRGFAQRYVSSVVVDRSAPQTLYAGLMNDKEFGGVFVSRNGGVDWQQLSAGLDGRDVLSLQQADDGTLVAGTNRGVFLLPADGSVWRATGTVLREKVLISAKTRRRKPAKKVASRGSQAGSELEAQVNYVELTPKKWFLASLAGLFVSNDEGKSWRSEEVAGDKGFIRVKAAESLVLAITHKGAWLLDDNGESWNRLPLPPYVGTVYSGAITPGPELWLATREGAFRSKDRGATWEPVRGGLPARDMAGIDYDAENHRLVAEGASGELFSSSDAGQSWQQQETGFAVRSLAFAPGRILAASAFDGVIAQPETASPARTVASGEASVQ